uniref:Uncharacterized protein n=1 Tax=Rhizophora mucronata TaxID=61149 RepID=A0A2P2JGQ7_RHIMU
MQLHFNFATSMQLERNRD